MNPPSQRRSKPRLKAALAVVFAVATLVAATGPASAATTSTSASGGKVTTMKVSW